MAEQVDVSFEEWYIRTYEQWYARFYEVEYRWHYRTLLEAGYDAEGARNEAQDLARDVADARARKETEARSKGWKTDLL